MPCSIIYLKDHEGKKKGERARVHARTLIQLMRLKVAKRVPAIASDFVPKEEKQKVNPKSMENLKKSKKPAKNSD